MKSVLVFGWGNPSRGDDALGPLFIEHAARMTDTMHCRSIEYLSDFQLQVEHALDLLGRARVLFVDATVTGAVPFEVSTLQAASERSVTTHAMSPAAVMQVFEHLHGRAPPPCTLLAIRGTRFELGESLSAAASANLTRALAWYRTWVLSMSRHDEAQSAPCTN